MDASGLVSPPKILFIIEVLLGLVCVVVAYRLSF